MMGFSDWLLEKLKGKAWKQADLARAAGLDSAVISNLINGRRGPGRATCTAIATAFELPISEVYRAAGLLPDLPTPRDQFEEILAYRLSLLTDDQLEDVLKYVEFISTREQRPVKVKNGI